MEDTMKNTQIPYEKITLLRRKEKFTNTTENMYEEVLPTRASIKRLGLKDGELLFEVVIPKPPPKFSKLPLSAIRWDTCDYEFKTLFKECDKLHLKAVVGRKFLQ
jgi:hypothetical protein